MFLPSFRGTAAALVLAAGTTSSLANCSSLLADFDAAVAAKSLDRAKQLEGAVKVDPICSKRAQKVRDRRVGLQVELASDARMPIAQREALLQDAVKVPDSWLAAWRFADLRMQQRHFTDAAALYDEAIQRAGNPPPFSDKDKRKLVNAAAAAKNLANDDDGGKRHITYVASTRAVNGVGGVFSPTMRALVPVAIPLPINFETNSANMTPNGSKAAEELMKALREQRITEVTLVGHTDERGPDGYNMELSQARVRRVAEYLQQQPGGANLHFNLVAKGKREPFDVSVLSFEPRQEEVWALDRRVDWLR